MIEALELRKTYGSVVAATDVSFRVAPGEVVGLLGPNGAGKTTVLRMLAGILTPSNGTARIDGIDVREDAFALKRRLGFLSGDTALYQRLTAREVLQFFGRLHGMEDGAANERIEALAREFRMSDFLDQRCAGLSAGQRQKANVARAFLHDPPALILDEPTTALDVITGRFLLDAIRRAKEAGKSVLFSTHIMGEAEQLCDRVVMIHRGRVVEQGTVAEVCARTGSKALADAFLRRIDEIEGAPR